MQNHLKIKSVFLIVYLLVLAMPVVTWIQNFRPAGGLYEYMRLAGLLAFTLLALQLAIGVFMLKLRPILGTGILKMHIGQGFMAAVIALLHPTLYAVQFGWHVLFASGSYLFLGRLGIILLILSVAAGLLRTAPFLIRHWRWIHRLNYLLLAVVYIHSWNLGSDVRNFPMVVLYWLIPAVLVAGIYYKLRPVYNELHGYN